MTFFPPFISRLNMGLEASLLLALIWCILDYGILLAYGLDVFKIITLKREKAVHIIICALASMQFFMPSEKFF